MNRLYLFFVIPFLTACQWSANNNNVTPVSHASLSSASAILPPQGYKRITLSKGSFGEWLRNVALKKDNLVHLFDGSLKLDQSAQFAVLDIPVGTKDLQQCADAILRLRSEYLLKKNQPDKIAFKATDGTLLSFADWRNGTRYKLSGNKLSPYRKTAGTTELNKDLESFLEVVFSYCGTYSLHKETLGISINDMAPGDVLVKPGSPGHAMIILDVAINDKGQKVFLLAQSFMPAQEIHIVKNPMHSGLSPWYQSNGIKEIITPQWKFNTEQLRRW